MNSVLSEWNILTTIIDHLLTPIDKLDDIYKIEYVYYFLGDGAEAISIDELVHNERTNQFLAI